MKLKSARLTRDVADAIEQARRVVEEDMGGRRHVDGTVVGDHEKPLVPTESCDQRGDGGIELFERTNRLGGPQSVLVHGMVELSRVDVDDRGVVRVEHSARLSDAIRHTPTGQELCPAEDRRTEPRPSKPVDADRERRDALLHRSFEHGAGPLPGGRVELRIPPRQQLDDPVVRWVEARVADHAVHAGVLTRRDRGQTARRRRREPGTHRRRLRQCPREGACVPRQLADRVDTETVEHEHHGPRHRGEREGIRSAEDRGERTRQHIGKARPRRIPGR